MAVPMRCTHCKAVIEYIQITSTGWFSHDVSLTDQGHITYDETDCMAEDTTLTKCPECDGAFSHKEQYVIKDLTSFYEMTEDADDEDLEALTDEIIDDMLREV